ncbi:hypothetical protein CM19_00425 [Candidatus Acidianus copahuensis]|uniref:Uncharacterized protein n=1 Tax=Candidatus Acidianus copahuensis TaxID=1160895 RepID=A0A031LMB4_9CREN|nr:hypothetical protein [Candidatus Acidianus copahuensis]EZQ02398.1 hypothetical protein CM19_10420 [Candidatus Acidianus copahuensis]EZQ02995.1 hypothetical protein CM19_10415 [Candidatus Acidianus copahuensis]EZQ11818.1 hypothetical protein CM19_00425 [Candidatus Acidianus copahuensis]
MKLLIAMDLNSSIEYSRLRKFVESLLYKFRDVDVTFLIDDGSILKLGNDEVFKVSDPDSFVELTKDLKSISTKKGNLRIGNIIRLKRELGRSILVLVSNRKVKNSDELILVYNGKKISALIGNNILHLNPTTSNNR